MNYIKVQLDINIWTVLFGLVRPKQLTFFHMIIG